MKPTLPPPSDVDSAPFWDALRRHQLQVQACDGCGRLLFPARPVCDRCGGDALRWTPVSGRGQVLSWIVTHQVFAPVLAEHVPYTTLLVRLDEQPDLMMYGNLADPEVAPSAGMEVQAVFEDHDDGFTLVQWSPA